MHWGVIAATGTLAAFALALRASRQTLDAVTTPQASAVVDPAAIDSGATGIKPAPLHAADNTGTPWSQQGLTQDQALSLGTQVLAGFVPAVGTVTLAGQLASAANGALVPALDDPVLNAKQPAYDEATQYIAQQLTPTNSNGVLQGLGAATANLAQAPIQVAQLWDALGTGLNNAITKIVPVNPQGDYIQPDPVIQAKQLSGFYDDYGNPTPPYVPPIPPPPPPPPGPPTIGLADGTIIVDDGRYDWMRWD
jgi:hypothetical protein